jgi:acyl-CoA synthetase (AMP-forming)/AMP-acid ligase II
LDRIIGDTFFRVALVKTRRVGVSVEAAPFQTLVEVCRHHACVRGPDLAYRWLRDGEVEDGTLTFAELDLEARTIAAHLQTSGLSGGRALLLYASGLQFISAFLGCLYGGVIPVPVSVPHRKQGLSKLRRIALDSQAAVVLTTETLPADAHLHCREDSTLGALRWFSTDSLSPALAERWQEPDISGETLALLQYTSGSTGSPKGVAATHDNLLENQRMIAEGFGHSEETVFVGWLPLHHDMGLIGNVLQPLYLGIPCTLMAPEAFAQKPVRWLRAISRYGGTTSGAPNFAYELCVKRVPAERREGLDLSHWKVAYNGAEPIRPGTMERFVEAFRPYGFREETFYPCYGLAEATLFVTGGLSDAPPATFEFDGTAIEERRVEKAGDDASDCRHLVGCGRPWKGLKVIAVDPGTCVVCGPDEIGEIWISGKSVAQGYENQPELSEATFRARLADTREGPFLRTGDLGFLRDGELFVTGRLKDLIIIRGRNHYPQDIEWTAGLSHPFLRPGCGAAVAVENSREEDDRLVVIQEIDRKGAANLANEGLQAAEAVSMAVRAAVVRQHGLRVHDVVLIHPGTLPKTSSGKVQRRASCERYLNGTLPLVYPESESMRAVDRRRSGGRDASG